MYRRGFHQGLCLGWAKYVFSLDKSKFKLDVIRCVPSSEILTLVKP